MNGSLMTTYARVAAAASLCLLAACSGDSPTAPRQNPPPGNGGTPATSWRITLSASPTRIAVNSTVPSTISVSVRRTDNGNPPANGTTLLLSTTLGEFGSKGSGITSGAVELTGGNGAVHLFGGSSPGQAIVTAQLESSVAQVTVAMQALVLTSASPKVGKPEGGDTVTITGQGFEAPVEVLFGSLSTTAAEGSATVLSVTADTIVVKTPPIPDPIFELNEPIDIRVTIRKGSADEASADLLGAFEYRSTFFIDRIQPSTGSANGGDVVTISGSGFESPVRVVFDVDSFIGDGGVPAEVLSVAPTQLQVRVPATDLRGEADKIVAVKVTIRVGLTGELSDILDNSFTYRADPTQVFHIASVSPNTGRSTGNQSVRVLGGGFTSPARVLFGGVAGVVQALTASEIRVLTPATTVEPGGQATVDVTVQLNPTGTAQEDTLPGGFTYFADASETFSINSVSPTTGLPTGGETVTIYGGGFDPPLRVTFGGQPAQIVSFDSSSVTVLTPRQTVPAGETLSVTVAVIINYNETGQATDSIANAFTYAYNTVDQPVVLSLSPASGPNEGGTTVRINGSGFRSPVQVFFGSGSTASFLGVEATVTSVTSTQIVVTTPAATGFGQDNRNQTVDVLVRNSSNGLATVAGDAFQYGTNVIITSIAPGSGPQTGGTRVIIFGQGFDEPVAVDFEFPAPIGGIAPQIISVTGTEVVVRMPAVSFSTGTPRSADGCPGDLAGPVHLVNIETGNDADGPAFTYGVVPMNLSGINPIEGPQAGGTSFTLTGTGLIEPTVEFSAGAFSASANISSVAADNSSLTGTTPRFSGTFDTDPCDDNSDGTEGTRDVPTPVDVVVYSSFSDCRRTLRNAFTYVPEDTTCHGDIAEQSIPEPAFTFEQVNGTAEVQFTDTSTNGPDAWFWDFTNDGVFDDFTQNPLFTYPGFGNFTVRFRAQNAAGFAVITQVITLVAPPAPVAGFTQTQSGATTTSATVQFNDTTTGIVTGLQWDFDNNGIFDSVAQNPANTFTTPGSKTTRLRATGPGGFDEDVQAYSVFFLPNASFTSADGVGLAVSFTDTSTGPPETWAWSFGDGGTANSQNPSHSYVIAGSYNVSLQVTNPAGTDSQVNAVNVLP
jgi:PKD repeat protein